MNNLALHTLYLFSFRSSPFDVLNNVDSRECKTRRIETGDSLSEITGFNTVQPDADHRLNTKHHELSAAKRAARVKSQPDHSIDH